MDAPDVGPAEANGPRREDSVTSTRYGRAQFLRDASWMGLDEPNAFSRPELRRQRDRLMNTHHPDRGGAEDMAARVNETYARMVLWLDRRRRFRRPEYRPKTTDPVVSEPTEDRPKGYYPAISRAVRHRAVQIYAAALVAAAGYSMFRRRR